MFEFGKIKSGIALLLVLAFEACTTIGTKFDVENVNQLRPGVSTIGDAIQLLGPAAAESAPGGNTRLLQWQFAQGSIGGGSAAHVAILFDRDGKMIRVTHKSKI